MNKKTVDTFAIKEQNLKEFAELFFDCFSISSLVPIDNGFQVFFEFASNAGEFLFTQKTFFKEKNFIFNSKPYDALDFSTAMVESYAPELFSSNQQKLQPITTVSLEIFEDYFLSELEKNFFSHCGKIIKNTMHFFDLESNKSLNSKTKSEFLYFYCKLRLSNGKVHPFEFSFHTKSQHMNFISYQSTKNETFLPFLFEGNQTKINGSSCSLDDYWTQRYSRIFLSRSFINCFWDFFTQTRYYKLRKAFDSEFQTNRYLQQN